MINENIKKEREKAGISQRELGRRINKTGQYISYLEKNSKSNPSIVVLSDIATALKIPLSRLIEKQETLTNKILRALEINFDTDAENVLELICELVDIDPDVIDEALKWNEDISESYLSKMLSVIYRDNPNLFLDFYNANKKLIDDSYSICSDTCDEILKKIKMKGILDEIDEVSKKQDEENKKNQIFSNRNKTINITEKDIKNYLFSIVKDILESSNNSTNIKYKLSDFSQNEIKEIGLFLYNSYQLKINEILERHKEGE